MLGQLMAHEQPLQALMLAAKWSSGCVLHGCLCGHPIVLACLPSHGAIILQAQLTP